MWVSSCLLRCARGVSKLQGWGGPLTRGFQNCLITMSGFATDVIFVIRVLPGPGQKWRPSVNQGSQRRYALNLRVLCDPHHPRCSISRKMGASGISGTGHSKPSWARLDSTL
eukprot:2829197-Prymnesium_polylepis.1